MIKICILLFFSCILCSEDFNSFKKENLKSLVDGYTFTEGPASDGKGNIYFTAPKEKEVVKWSAKSGKSVFFKNEDGLSALYFHKDKFYATQGSQKRVVSLSLKGDLSPVVEKYNSKPFNKPNDLWVSSAGNVYFTDPNYGRKELSQDGEFAYVCTSAGKTERIDAIFKRPNGIIGSKDGKKLYITDAGASKTYIFDLDKNGIPGPQRLFCDIGGDGMTLDCKGNLYIAVPRQKSLVIISRDGKEISRIKEFGCTNVCFGGENGKTLFITAKPGLLSIEMPFKGMFTD